MADNRTIEVKFGANTTEFDAGLRGMNSAISALKKDLTDLNKSLRLDPDNIDKLEEKLQNLEQQAKIGADKIKELKDEQEALGKDKVASPEWEKLEEQINRTQLQMNDVAKATDLVKEHIAEVGDAHSIYNLNKSLKDTQTDLDNVNKMLKFDPENTDLLAQKMQLVGQYSDISAEKIEKLKQEEKELGDEKVGTAEWRSLQTQIADTTASAGRVKQSIEDVGTASEEAGEKSKTFGDVLKGSFLGNILANGVMQLGMAIQNLAPEMVDASEEAQKFSNSLRAEGYGKEEINEARESLENYANQSKYSFDALAKQAQLFAGAGVKNFAEVTQGLATLGQASGASEQELGQMSQTFARVEASGKLSTMTISQMFKTMPQAVKPFEDELMKLSGIHSIDDLNTALSHGKISAGTMNEALAELGKNKGLQQIASQNITLKDGLQELKDSTTEAGAELIEAFGDGNIKNAIQTLRNVIKTVADTLSGVIKVIMQNKVAFAILATAIGAVVIAIKGINAVATVVKSIQMLSGAFAVLNAVMDANPIGAIILAITAVVAALTLFFTKTKTGQKIWQDFMNVLKPIFEFLTNVGRTAFKGIEDALNALKPVLTAIGSLFSTVFNGLKTAVNNVVPFIQAQFKLLEPIIDIYIKPWIQTVTAVFDAIRDVVQTVIRVIKDLLTGNFKDIGKAFTDLGKNLMKIAVNLWKSIVKDFQDGIKSIVHNVSLIWSKIGKFFKNIPNQVMSAIKGLANTGKQIVTWIKNGVSGLWGSISHFFTSLPKKIEDALSSVKDLGGKIIHWIVSGLGGLGSAIGDAVQSAIHGLGSFVGDIAKKVTGGKGLDGHIQVGHSYGMIARTKEATANPPLMYMNAVNGGDTLNINVSATNTAAKEIATEIERIIVRRLHK